MKYDYRCNNCKLTFEIECKMSETTPTHRCPTCQEDSPKVFYATPIHGFRQGPARIIDPDVHWEDRRNKEKTY